MRNRLMGSILAVVAAAMLAFSAVILAQTARQSGAAGMQTAVPTADLSGVWTQRLRAGVTGHGFIVKEASAMQPWAEQYFKAVRVGTEHDPNEEGRDDMNPTIQCFPSGPTRIQTGSGRPFEIVQIPGRVLMLFEKDHWVRQIFMDGRAHPTDRVPNWMGHSTGRWDGDTLVVDLVGLNDLTWLDALGHPHTEALHVVERYRRVDHDTLENELTFDDPKAYTKPWTGKQVFQLRPGWEILEDVVCEEHLMKDHLPKVIRGPRP